MPAYPPDSPYGTDLRPEGAVRFWDGVVLPAYGVFRPDGQDRWSVVLAVTHYDGRTPTYAAFSKQHLFGSGDLVQDSEVEPYWLGVLRATPPGRVFTWTPSRHASRRSYVRGAPGDFPPGLRFLHPEDASSLDLPF